jgi:hypothetical protein
MTDEQRRRSVPDRARRRAIRTRAARAGVPYSVAARHLDGGLDPPATTGRTVYPGAGDPHRGWLLSARANWSYAQRVRDTRQAVRLPVGRAEHLVARFPVLRGAPGGPLYHGDARPALLAMVYATVVHERPDLVASTEELAWVANLGEETAVDLSLAALDRAARELAAQDRWRMWGRIEAALAAAAAGRDRELHWAAITLRYELESLSVPASVDGVRHTLDALLVASAGGHAPGTRVRVRARSHRGRRATIVGVRWARSGPPVGYDVRPDVTAELLAVAPRDLSRLPDVAFGELTSL